ncbi:MAG: glycosyltransferase family 4 protein [Deltaproteobacteria bacterium]|nr:glycosyltransferase family 4 protein [Deltaproteobacteria bacterium]
MIKVLHIITRLDQGGSATNTLMTVAGLESRGFAMTLLYGKTVSLPREAVALREKIAMKEVPALLRELAPYQDLIAFYQLWQFIRRGGFTVVHTHSSKAGILGRWAAWCARVPVIVHTPHGHVFYGYFGWFTTRLCVWLERLTALVTDRIVTLTEREKAEHIEWKIAGAEKFTTIPSGVDLQSVSSPKSQVSSLKPVALAPPGSLLVGTVGRFEAIKGHRYLVEAIPLVLAQVPTAWFLFIGDGPLRSRLEQQTVQLGVATQVTFTGWQAEPAALMALCDLIVLPSLNEGMGRVLVEAMALGKALVASSVGGIPDLVQEGKNGLLVPPADPPRLAQAIISLLTDKSRREQMGAKGQHLAPAFSAEVMLEKIEKLYQDLLACRT